MLSFFETIAGRLKPRRKQILLGAAIGFVLLIAMVWLGAPQVLSFSILLITWWLWLANMLIGMFYAQKAGTDELAGLVFSAPGFRHFFLLILIAMAVLPVVWFILRVV